MSPSPTARRAGLTLLEVLTATGLFILVIGSVFGVLGASQQSLVESSAQADMEITARRILGRIAEDFRSGMVSTLLMESVADSRSSWMAQAADYDAGAVTQGPVVGYQWIAEPGDPTNGTDDDGDGHVDEGSVVRFANGALTTIAGNVKDLRFTLEGDHIRCVVSLERMVRGRHTFTFVDAADIRMRN